MVSRYPKRNASRTETMIVARSLQWNDVPRTMPRTSPMEHPVRQSKRRAQSEPVWSDRFHGPSCGLRSRSPHDLEMRHHSCRSSTKVPFSASRRRVRRSTVRSSTCIVSTTTAGSRSAGPTGSRCGPLLRDSRPSRGSSPHSEPTPLTQNRPSVGAALSSDRTAAVVAFIRAGCRSSGVAGGAG